jgi:hypothetical protein
MRHRYTVELRRNPADSISPGLVTTRVRAKDRFEAVAMARRYVERQYPHIDLATIETWVLPRRLD